MHDAQVLESLPALNGAIEKALREVLAGLSSDMTKVGEMQKRLAMLMDRVLPAGFKVTTNRRNTILVQTPTGEVVHFCLILSDSPRRRTVPDMLRRNTSYGKQIMQLLEQRDGSVELVLIFAARFDNHENSATVEKRLRQCEQDMLRSARNELDEVQPGTIVLQRPLRTMLLVLPGACFQADLSYAGKALVRQVSEEQQQAL